MNIVAITIGLIYGVAAAVAGYLVSQLASGLFARPFYRIYARVLIGICLIMLLAPVLQGAASLPVAAKVLLSVADYCAFFVLGCGVVVFNRKFMKSVFLQRRITAYFTFGTLVYATLVTLVLLHLSATVDLTTGMAAVAPVGPGHYAPFAMLLAALVFHTDHHLKLSSKSVRQFSTFTFVGYAISFVAIGLSMMPYFGEALAGLGLRTHEELFLANFSCAQTLFLAIILYAALVWHRDSIPPVYLLLLAICAEYHVLVTQWLIRDDVLGTSAWALAAMPLVIGIDALANYFKLWDEKRQKRQELLQTADGEARAALLGQGQPRFATPFAAVSSGLTAGLLLLTLWTRFSTNVAFWSPSWLAITFVAYAIYYSISAVVQRDPVYIYASALLAGTAALCGVDPIFSPLSVLILAILAAIWLGMATISERWRLRQAYRTALADAGLISAVVALLIVLVRHCIEIGQEGTGPYMFGTVMLADFAGLASMTLVLVALALALATRAYRSRLPMYGALASVVAIAPVMSAGIAFVACALADIIRHRIRTTGHDGAETPLRLFDRVGLPQQDQTPELYAGPLTAGTLPLSFMGLAIAVYDIVCSGVFPGVLPEVSARATWLPILGAITSALVLGLFTRSHRWRWLYVVSLAAGYFGVHSGAQLLAQPASLQFSFHLVLTTALSLVGWVVAAGYSTWCWIWIKRVAEEAEVPLRERQQFYAGTLFVVSFAAATAVLSLLSCQTLLGGAAQAPGLWLLTSVLLAVYFALSSGTFGSQIGSYLSLYALGMTAWGLAPYMFDGAASLQNTGVALTQSLSLQLLALALAALANVFLRWIDRDRESEVLAKIPKLWTESPLPLRAEGWLLWAQPMAQSALAFTFLAVIQVGVTVNELWRPSGAVGIANFHLPLPALVTCGLAAVTSLICTWIYRNELLYVTAVAATYLTIHATVQTYWLSGLEVEEILSYQLLLASSLSIVGWGVATAISAWWWYWINRVTEEASNSLRERQQFFAGTLFLCTGTVATTTLMLLGALSLWMPAAPVVSLSTAVLLAIIFAFSKATFRSQVGSYLCFASLGLAVWNLGEFEWLPLGTGDMVVSQGFSLQLLGFLLAVFSCLCLRRIDQRRGHVARWLSPWETPPLLSRAERWQQWAKPAAQFALLYTLVAVVVVVASHVLASVEILAGFDNPGPRLVGCALAAVTLLLCTRAYRVPLLYITAIFVAYSTVHATAHTFWFTGFRELDSLSSHVLLLATVSVLAWSAAQVYSTWCEIWKRHSAESTNETVCARELFYAELLRRFSLAAGIVALLLLCMLTLVNQIGASGDPRITVIAGLGLAALFGIELATFRSPSLCYLSLGAICLSGYNVVAWLPLATIGVHDGVQLTFDGVMLSLVGLVMGLLAWTSSSLIRPSERVMAQLPMPAADSWQSLWVAPLASTSIVLGFVALAHILSAWGQAAMFWTVLPFYLASAAWILGTSLGLQGKLATPWILPDGLYALAIATTCVALHVTSHVWLLPAQTTLSATLSWHLLVNGCMLIGGWGVATVYALGYAKVQQTNEEACNDERLEVYAGQLNHVTAVVATISLPFLWWAGWLCEPAISPVVFAAGLLLAAYFGLAALTYRSQIGSYLSLAAVSVTAFHFFSVIGLWQQLPETVGGLGMAGAGLLMIAVASVLYRRREVADEEGVLGKLPSPWTSASPFLKETTFRRLWCRPLANFSLLLAVVSIGLASPSFTLLSWSTEQPENREMVPVAATILVASATGLLAARIYRTGALSYAAGVALWLSVYPLLAIIGVSATQGGPVFGGLALLLWLASFAVEWLWPLHQDSTDNPTSTDDLPSNAADIFERPLVRCGAIAAILAIVHSLVHCSFNGWIEHSSNLLISCGAAAVTLLLAARSMQVLNRIGRARLLVYLGCLAASACWIVAAVAVWGFDGLPWAAAVLAMVLASVGLVLKESTVNYDGSGTGARLRLFGEPIANVALAFPAFAVLATILTTLLAGPPWLALSLSLIGMTVAYLISVRTTANPLWLYPSAIAATGAALVLLWGVFHLTVGKLMFASLLLMHALVVVARVIHGHRRRARLLLGVDGTACERAFREWPLVVTVGVVLGQVVYFLNLAAGSGSGPKDFWPWPLTTGLAVLLFLHIGYLKWQPALSHFAIGSSLLTLAWLGLWSEWTFSPDVVLLTGGLLWGSIATIILRSSVTLKNGPPRSTTKLGVLTALARPSICWSAALCGLATLITVPCWIILQPAYPTTCICWLLIATACAWWGYEWHMGPSGIGQRNIETHEPGDLNWVKASVAAEALAAVLLLLSVGAGLFFIRDSAARFAGDLFSLAGLAATVLAIVYVTISSRLRKTTDGDEARERFLCHAGVALSYVAALAAGVATVLLLPSVYLGSASLLPAISLALLAGCWFYLAWQLWLEPLVYVAEAVVAGFALYLRYGILGREWGPDFETAFGIVCGSFILYGLHTFLVSCDAHKYRLFQRPFYRTSIALPLILPLVTPYQPQQLRFSLVVFATGALYSLIGYHPGRRWPLYVAACLYNLGIYLWVPVISDTFSLMQLYVIPAALTVLIFAHLHRRDLNHQALTGVRLMAASTILAVSTFDAFFGAADQSLNQFIVVLLLSLAAIAAGIATHVRPFVYAGIAFMVINVLGQLGLQFHVTEDGIVRAAILIALGLFVIAVMVFFNIRREQILKRYHHFLSDPRWE